MGSIDRASRAFNVLAGVIVLLLLTGGVTGTVRIRAASSPLLPEGSSTPGREGVEESALELARSLRAVPQGPGEQCPDHRLRVSWEDPGDGYEVGAHLVPVGPAPSAATTDVNGVVLCAGSTYGYFGFEAHWQRQRWVLFPVPDLPNEVHIGGERAATAGAPLVVLPAGRGEIGPRSAWHSQWGPEIEPLSAFEPQRECDPTPKAGTVAFARLVLDVYSATRSYGIGRPCEEGPRSEHKEGRAWDWGVAVSSQVENRAANELISWLLATDEHGNRYAMARRLGVMYVVWDRHVWAAYQADAGWRPYHGRSPHTDHVHISFNRAGGAGKTSFWDAVDLVGLAGDDLFGGLPPDFDGFDSGGRLVHELGPRVDVPGRVRRPMDPRSPAPRPSVPPSTTPAAPALPGDGLLPIVPPAPGQAPAVGPGTPGPPGSGSTPPAPGTATTRARTTPPPTTAPRPRPTVLPTAPTLSPTTTRPPTTTTTRRSTTVPTTRPTVATTLPTVPTTLPTVPTTLPTVPTTLPTSPTTVATTLPTAPSSTLLPSIPLTTPTTAPHFPGLLFR